MSVGWKVSVPRICGRASLCFYTVENQGAWFVVILRVA